MKKGVDYIGVSAGAMIFNENGELFLSKRSQNTTNERGCWETPGGGVDFGETLESAVQREMQEEYGVDIDIIETFPPADHLIPEEKQHWIATTFLAKIRDGQTPTIREPEKCDEIGWFSLNQLPSPLSIITQLDLQVYNDTMMSEMVDIVDEQAAVLYKTAKKRAHKLGLLHKTVIAQVITSKGDWILVKQASDRQDAGQYVSPVGGHITAGETDEEALKREAMEELGLNSVTYKYIGKGIYNRNVLGRHENHYFILYEIYSDQKPTLNHESVSYSYFSSKELQTQLALNPKDFGNSFLFIIKNFYPQLLK